MNFNVLKNVGLSLALVLLTARCVSIGFKTPEAQKSEAAKLTPPGAPFVEVKSLDVDEAWRDEKIGSTITYLSDCGNPTDPSLQNIFKGITAELDDVVMNESNVIDYNAREALHANLDGKVDGVPTRLELVIFKKNSCIYILTYASTTSAFATHQRAFAKFVKEFKVP